MYIRVVVLMERGKTLLASSLCTQDQFLCTWQEMPPSPKPLLRTQSLNRRAPIAPTGLGYACGGGSSGQGGQVGGRVLMAEKGAGCSKEGRGRGGWVEAEKIMSREESQRMNEEVSHIIDLWRSASDTF